MTEPQFTVVDNVTGLSVSQPMPGDRAASMASGMNARYAGGRYGIREADVRAGTGLASLMDQLTGLASRGESVVSWRLHVTSNPED